jgi:hypothetical protein
MLGAVILLGDQLAVPGEDGVRGDEAGHFIQRLLAQLLAQFGERLPLAVAQAHAARDLLAQDTVFCDQIFIAKQEFLVHRARNIGQ